MNLSDLLQSKHDSIVERWLHAVVATYPSGSSNHLLNQRDRFHNPVGDVLRRGLPVLLSALADTEAGDDPSGAIGDIVRIRTVQCQKPSQAVAWVFALKDIARSELGEAGERAELAPDWKEFLACKEVIGEIRVREAQMRSAKLIEQVNKLYGGVEESRDSDVDNKSNAGNL